ncbi:hypothetical protein FB451DRAFT_1379905 [Mycena latifolia]|nr:hypothetical protein FB451DRAFT_1379905 [Mycena latifolia]
MSGDGSGGGGGCLNALGVLNGQKRARGAARRGQTSPTKASYGACTRAPPGRGAVLGGYGRREQRRGQAGANRMHAQRGDVRGQRSTERMRGMYTCLPWPRRRAGVGMGGGNGGGGGWALIGCRRNEEVAYRANGGTERIRGMYTCPPWLRRRAGRNEEVAYGASGAQNKYEGHVHVPPPGRGAVLGWRVHGPSREARGNPAGAGRQVRRAGRRAGRQAGGGASFINVRGTTPGTREIWLGAPEAANTATRLMRAPLDAATRRGFRIWQEEMCYLPTWPFFWDWREQIGPNDTEQLAAGNDAEPLWKSPSRAASACTSLTLCCRRISAVFLIDA